MSAALSMQCLKYLKHTKTAAVSTMACHCVHNRFTLVSCVSMHAVVQILNDVERIQTDIAAAQKREQELLTMVQQAKQGKEDSVSTSSSFNQSASYQYMVFHQPYEPLPAVGCSSG